MEGFASTVSVIECSPNGWTNVGVSCDAVPEPDPNPPAPIVTPDPNSQSDKTTTSPGNSDDGDGGLDTGGAVAITIVVMLVVGAGVFFYIRYRQGKLVIKKATDYTTTFGEPENV